VKTGRLYSSNAATILYVTEKRTAAVNSICEIPCGEQLNISHCAELYTQLLTAMAEGQAVSIDISQLERVDTAALQLLYDFQREAKSQGLVTIWSQASKVFCDAVDILGMDAFYLQKA
jgi:ABC-type transporter Mla MlaB component